MGRRQGEPRKKTKKKKREEEECKREGYESVGGVVFAEVPRGGRLNISSPDNPQGRMSRQHGRRPSSSPSSRIKPEQPVTLLYVYALMSYEGVIVGHPLFLPFSLSYARTHAHTLGIIHYYRVN